MNLSTTIASIRENIFSNPYIGVSYYYYVTSDIIDLDSLSSTSFAGEVESTAHSSFINDYVTPKQLEKAFQSASNNKIGKNLNVYHIIGIELQAKMQSSPLFQSILHKYFQEHSLKYKYLIQKVFPEYKEAFIQSLKLTPLSYESRIEEKLFYYIFLENEFSTFKILEEIKALDDIDVPILVALEELSRMKSSAYENERKKLLELLIWASSEIQSKHRIYNNNEDQFNSVFHTLMSKDFKVENQSQRGITLSGRSFGELDVEVFTKNGYPLSIVEGLVISTIDKKYISDHLIKLTKNYDPNGLKQNFAIIYAKHKNFPVFWDKYKNFVSSFQFPHEMTSSGIIDISNNYPSFANIRIGLTEHKRNDCILEVYHIFMNMYFE